MFNFNWADIDMSDEEQMLNELDANILEALDRANEAFEAGIDDTDTNFITIIVNGIAHRFLLGGPQVAGLNMFIEQICIENGYAVPGSISEDE